MAHPMSGMQEIELHSSDVGSAVSGPAGQSENEMTGVGLDRGVVTLQKGMGGWGAGQREGDVIEEERRQIAAVRMELQRLKLTAEKEKRRMEEERERVSLTVFSTSLALNRVENMACAAQRLYRLD